MKDIREDLYEDYIRYRYRTEAGVIDCYYDALYSSGTEILSYIETNEFANREEFINGLKKLAKSLRRKP